MIRLLLLFILLLPIITHAQEIENDSISRKNLAGHWNSKRKFRLPANAARQIFYRFTDNPAFTGIENSFYVAKRPYRQNINVGYYNGWPGLAISIGDRHFRAPSGYFATYEMALGKKLKNSIGINFLNNQNGYSKGLNVGIAYAYEMRFTRHSLLRLGMGINYFQRSLKFNDLGFGDMMDARYGYIYETQEIQPTPSIGYTDINLGLLLKLKHFQFGGSFISLTQPDMGFLGLSRKPTLLFLHSQYNWYISRKITITPYAQLKLSMINRFTPGVTVSFMEKYIVGVNLENMNVAKGLIGYEFQRKYRLTLSGGIPIEKELRALSYTGHVECGFRYLFGAKKEKKDETED